MIVPKSGSFPSSACCADKLPICTITTSTFLPCLAMSIATFSIGSKSLVIVIVVKVVVEVVLLVVVTVVVIITVKLIVLAYSIEINL